MGTQQGEETTCLEPRRRRSLGCTACWQVHRGTHRHGTVGTGLCSVTKAGVQLVQQEPPELCFARPMPSGEGYPRHHPPSDAFMHRSPLADLETSRAPVLTEGG